MQLKSAALLALMLITVFLTKSLWPTREQVIVPPKIVTQWDTIARLDTVWRTKLVEKTKWDTTYLERVTITQPETVTVRHAYMLGISAVYVGKNVGDSMIVDGFFQGPNPHTGLDERREWRARWWVAGPLEAVSLDTFPPRASFYDAPKVVRHCETKCKALHVVAGILLKATVDALNR